ncbi:heptaprenylglyceryl phosphate synthase [Bacillaceae bacterium]
MPDIHEWRHVFKLDPDKTIGDEALEKVCESGTDAIVVGGTQGITFDNTLDLLSRVRRYSLPVVQEISRLDAVVPGFDLYLVPLVLNARDPDWILAPHQKGLKKYGALVRWEETLVEGYIVLNPRSQVAQVTRSETGLSLEDVVAYARMADRLLQLPVCYLEYSGMYGDPAVVRAVKEVLRQSRLFYGGGIRTAEQAREMAEFADTIVVGNLVYEDLLAALETVAAVKRVPQAFGDCGQGNV